MTENGQKSDFFSKKSHLKITVTRKCPNASSHTSAIVSREALRLLFATDFQGRALKHLQKTMGDVFGFSQGEFCPR